MADQRRSGPKIEHHPLVAALASDPSKPPDRTTKLFGYPGPSSEESSTRLWLDLDLSSYVDIPNDTVRYSQTLPDDAGTILWVTADAPLNYGSVTSHAAQAEFLSGSIATAHLGGAGAPGGPIPPTQIDCPTIIGCPTLAGCPPPVTQPPQCPVLTQFCPPPTIPPQCPIVTQFPQCGITHFPPECPPPSVPIWQCPSHIPACRPSVIIRCPSFGICPTSPVVCHPSTVPACHPSVVIACPSVQIRCPTATIACRPSVVVVCPSIQVVCPTSPVACNVSVGICPTRLCPSIASPCQTTPGCPITAGCPGPGPDPGPFGGGEIG